MCKCAIIFIAVLMLPNSVAAVPFENSSVIDHVPDRVMVTLKPGIKLDVDKSLGLALTGRPELDNLAVKHGFRDIELLYGPMINSFDDPKTRALLESVYTVDFSDKSGLKSVIDDFAKLDIVDEVHPVAITRLYSGAFLPNDLGSAQWYLRNMSLGSADIRALGGWAETLGDSNVVVAILDSGVDWHHPDLGGPHPDKVNGALWTNWAEYHGTPGQDSDGNGYVDDIRGWDFVNVSSSQVWPGEDHGPPDNDPMDFDGHGTNCAGLVAPLTDNGIGIAGTAPGAKIMAVRVGWKNASGTGVVRMDFCAQGMVYAAANGAKILNASWGNTSSLSSAVTTCLNAGMLIFAAAGNSNDEVASYLGGYNDPQRRVLAVAATTPSDQKSSFSSYGTWVDLSAPGVSMRTTHYDHNTGQSTYHAPQGTSFASPLAAAAAALIWSSDLSQTAAQVSQILRDSCDDIDHLNPSYAGKLGAGRVNLLRALGDNIQKVPGEFLLLRDAVHSASVGDTIKVLASHVESTVLMLGKSLKVLGGYAEGYQHRDPVGNPSVLQGGFSESALRFFGPVDHTFVLDGFEFQGGGGTFASTPVAGYYGGGLFVNGVSPTLHNLRMTGNSVGSSNFLGLGGGIALVNSQSTLENIVVEGNGGIRGAGVYIYGGAPTLSDVTIADNVPLTVNNNHPPRGGGLHIVDATVTLDGFSINGHLVASQGGGVYITTSSTPPTVTMLDGSIADNSARTHGAGLYINGGTLEITDVDITGNTAAPLAFSLEGGGLFAEGASVNIMGAVLDQNSAATGSGAHFVSCPEVLLTNSLITNNTVEWAGGLYLQNCTSAVLTNLTLANNHSAVGPAALYAEGTTLTVSNTISAFNTGDPTVPNGIYIEYGSTFLNCNNVFGNDGGGYGGIADPTGTDGNIALDPLFCNADEGDYHLQTDSPCAPEHSGSCGLIGALGVGCDDFSDVTEPDLPLAFRVEANFPNPFNPSTTIRFSTPTPAHTTVAVFDLKGRMINQLVNEVLPASTHSVLWLGNDDRGRPVPTGIYFYRVTSGEHQAVGRMALVK